MRTGILARAFAIAVVGSGVAQAQRTPPPGPYHGHMVVRVPVANEEELARVLDAATTSWNCEIPRGAVDVQVTPEQMARLREMGFEGQVVIPDVQALLDANEAENRAARMQRDAAWFSAFRTLGEIHARLDSYAANYPAIVSTFTAGQTLEGRPIRGVRITAPDLPGNPRSSRPAVLFNATQHAREWATPMTAMWIADRLIEGYGVDPRLTSYVESLEIIVIPVVNADGYEWTWLPNNRLWRKNRRDNGDGTFGVDTNRNWGYQWGGEGASTNTNSETYRGTGPFSEPETQVMRDFIIANPRLKAHIDFHSYSQLILTAWGYTGTPPAERPIFQHIEDAMEQAIFDVHGRVYVGGPAYTTIYPASGVAPDWTYGDRGLLSCTIEVRDTGSYGFVMPVSEIIPNAEENFEAALKLADFAALPLVVAPVGTMPTTVPSGGASVRVAVRNNTGTLSGTPLLWSRSGQGTWASAPMASAGGIEYAGTLTGGGCAETLEYYVEAWTTDGRVARFPAGGSDEPLAAASVARVIAFEDDMETERGWAVGAPGDTATTGLWARCAPQATAAQPGSDHTPGAGTLAWITDCRAGTGVGSYDVDGGTTTLTSPRLNPYVRRTMFIEDVRVGFWRWYSNNAGSNPNSDVMPVLASNDDGQTWVPVAQINDNLGAWTYQEISLSAALPVTDRMRVRFVAQDLGGGSIVEAGVDDFALIVEACLPDPDVNCDGSVDGFDVLSMEEAVGGDFTGFCQPNADFNRDGSVDGFDVLDLEVAVGGG
jgi:murein tripeptide amidase MpaA